MRVALDVAPLGSPPGRRTGLFRIVDYLTRGLAAAPQCDVKFVCGASFGTLRDCASYVRQDPVLSRVGMSVSPSIASMVAREARIRRLRTNIKDGSAVLSLIREGDVVAAAKELRLVPRLAARALTLTQRAAWRERPLDRTIVDRADIYHSPAFPLEPCGPLPKRFLTFHDLIPIQHPEWVLPDHLAFLTQIVRSIAPRDWVITPSAATRDDLCTYLPFDSERVFIIPWAADPTIFTPVTEQGRLEETRVKYHIPEGRYVLSLATLEPRRNIGLLVRSFGAVCQQQRVRDVSLVLVGAHGWGLRDLTALAERSGIPDGRFVITGYAPDEDLAPLYSGAEAFVYPSLAEGFGLTPLEAMQCGVPVITSNATSLPEVVGDAAIQFDPHDQDALCQALVDVWNDSDRRRCMSQRSLARAATFSWERCVAETLRAYHMALTRAD